MTGHRTASAPVLRRPRRISPDLNRERYVSTLQVAESLGVSTVSVQRWFDAGLLAGARLPGGKRMIDTARLKEFLARQGFTLPENPGGKPVVLLVDDEPFLLDQMKAALEMTGRWHVLAASNGLLAGALLAEHAPDCVVVDVMLDDLGGERLVRTIRSTPAGARTRIVAISGQAAPVDVDRIRKAGADAYLVKPFRMRALEEAILAGSPDAVRSGA